MIEPYYTSDDGRVTLYCGDCLEVMPTLDAGSVDAVVTDIPYGVQKAAWDDELPPYGVWMLCKRLCRDGASILVFGGIKHLQELMIALNHFFYYEWTFAWYKSNAMQFGKTGFNVLDLPVWYSKNGGAKAHAKCRDVIEQAIVPSANDFGHPTPKPVKLMCQLTACVSPTDALILDPFMGSGTTGVACVKTGRRFIGIEIDEGYCAIAKRRIVDAMAQGRLFGATP